MEYINIHLRTTAWCILATVFVLNYHSSSRCGIVLLFQIVLLAFHPLPFPPFSRQLLPVISFATHRISKKQNDYSLLPLPFLLSIVFGDTCLLPHLLISRPFSFLTLFGEITVCVTYGHVNLYRLPWSPPNHPVPQQRGRRLGPQRRGLWRGHRAESCQSLSPAAKPTTVRSPTCGTCCQASRGRQGLAPVEGAGATNPSASPAPATSLSDSPLRLSGRSLCVPSRHWRAAGLPR